MYTLKRLNEKYLFLIMNMHIISADILILQAQSLADVPQVCRPGHKYWPFSYSMARISG